MNLDLNFVNAVLDIRDKDLLLSAFKKVPPNYIKSPIERKVYKFIRKYYSDTKGKLPSIKAVKLKFNSFERVKVEDHITFYVQELNNRIKYYAITDGVTSISNVLLESKDIEKAEGLYYEIGRKLGEYNLTETATILSTLDDREARYESIKNDKGLLGYQTGLKVIDDKIGGIVSEMVVILGAVGVGKTFFLLKLLANIWHQLEAPIVCVSNELPDDIIYGRLDAFMGNFPYGDYKRGALSEENEKKLKGLKNLYKNYHDLHVVNGAGKSVDEIEYEILSLEPSLIIVDGLYLTDMGKNDQFKDTVAASRAYQRMLKKYNIPGFFTSQITNDDQAKYARAISEDADIVLKLSQPPALMALKKMKVEALKVREAENKIETFLNWDFDKWDFSETDLGEREEAYEIAYSG